MAVAYFDMFSGISGDMALAALVHLGFSADELEAALRLLSPPGLEIDIREEKRGPIAGVKVRFSFSREDERPATPRLIREIVEKSGLGDTVKERSLRVFERLFKAEAAVHGVPVDEVHLHEAGGWDTVADVVGVVQGVESLGIRRVYASPVPLGSGVVQTEHGALPVPAPATVEILKRASVCPGPQGFEVTTPTGAALIMELASSFGPPPYMTLEKVGYGLGERDAAGGLPNSLRVMVGREARAAAQEELSVLEATIDDMSPQFFEPLMEALFEEGALDVAFIPCQMKKNRPGVLVSAVAEPGLSARLAEVMLRESTTLGVRITGAKRLALKRRPRTIETEYGPVRVKEAEAPGGGLRYTPEYEDLKRIARERAVTVFEVESAVRKALFGEGETGGE